MYYLIKSLNNNPLGRLYIEINKMIFEGEGGEGRGERERGEATERFDLIVYTE